LIAQSLNQIEKAYGEHNSILDNCHVRVAFATNDEHTARRISDALGIATEQRAMRNYAGHRLAPWLAHVMVSRQETARPLLTTGEVMQLPPADELVLVSGMAPIRAKKLRYYEDPNFRDRLLPPPQLASGAYADRPRRRPDDWSGRICGRDDRLGPNESEPVAVTDEGGLQQQRHPGLGEEQAKKLAPPKQLDLLGLDKDDVDPVTESHAMDRAGTTGTLIRAHTIDQGRDRDTVPGF
jgi:type IV secretion system protein VirD4